MDKLENLSEEERAYLVEILQEIESKGKSKALEELWSADYNEKPVPIYEFLTNDEYLGKSLKDPEGNLTIYDYWVDKLERMFAPNEDNPIQEVALSGCIGSGKSTCAVIGMAYFLYRLLCLKSPASYYRLATNSTIALAFFNITLNQSYGVGYAKLQNYCKNSPWFLKHGKVLGRTNPTYYPDNIDILVGSKNEHFIGHDIFCLSGDTLVITTDGMLPIEELVNNPKYVYTSDETGLLKVTEQPVEAKLQIYVKEIVEITLDDGTKVHCTSDHKFLTSEGWLDAKELKGKDLTTSKVEDVQKYPLTKFIPVYDIVNSKPYHNFLIKTNSSYIVSHNCAMLDEIDFAKGQDASLEKSAIMKLYSSVKRRIESRFMRKGRVPGLLFLVSSKNNIYDFLETYINMNRDNPQLMIIDEPLWVVKASVGNYSGETFKVAVGNRYHPSKILTSNDDWEAIEKVQKVIDVPIEHYDAFKINLNLALADIAGIALVSSAKYFNIEKVIATYRSYLQNPFIFEEISLGFDDDSKVSDFIDESLLPKSNRGTQSYHIHWDVSKNGDRTGLSMTTASDHVKVKRVVKGEVKEVVDVIHKIVFAVAISARAGEEIPFYKIREFVYWLRDIGFNIVTITCDSFQCLPADTLIKTNNGDKRIVDLTSYDNVLAFSFKSGLPCFAPFTNLRQTGIVDRLYVITTFDNRTIECTGNHPILTDKGYLRADEISKQNNIVCLNIYGNPEVQKIQSIITKKVSKLPVYDIEVPYYNNFTLANGIIVHNSVDTIQQFKLQGFESYTLSVDRSRDPYTALRNAVNEGRLIAPKISLLEAEYADVEDDPVKNKIDHTPTGCLLPNTLILTWRGAIPIQELAPTDTIFAFYQGTIVSGRFTNLRVTKQVTTYYRITTDWETIIECTEDHPILTPTQYARANSLIVGSALMVANKDLKTAIARVVKIDVIHTDNPIPVYDIEVPKYSNFLLANGMIVHNSKDVLDSIAANVYKAGSYEAPSVTSNTVANLLDLNESEDDDELLNWLLPPGTTVIDFFGK